MKRIIPFVFLFFCISASASVQVYNHAKTYATSYNNTVFDLTIDSPYSWKFISYSSGGTSANVEVLFTISWYSTPCRWFDRTYALTSDSAIYDKQVEDSLVHILDPTKQSGQQVIHAPPVIPNYTGKIIMCAVNSGTHDPTVAINIALGYGISNTPLDTFTIDGQHGISCSLAVYNWIDSNVVFFSNYTSPAVAYASLTGAVAVVCSDAGQATDYPYYPGIQTFVPLGSNTWYDLYPPDSIPNAITSGTAGPADTNITAYGPGLEFIATATNLASSFSNGYVAGQLFKIYQSRNKGWWDARYAARVTASNGGIWNIKSGYGIPNVAAAIAWNGALPPDPY